MTTRRFLIGLILVILVLGTRQLMLSDAERRLSFDSASDVSQDFVESQERKQLDSALVAREEQSQTSTTNQSSSSSVQESTRVENSDCLRVEQFHLDSNLHKRWRWHEERGDRNVGSDVSYYAYPDKTLVALAANGDLHAIHVHALNMRAKAFGISEGWPVAPEFFSSPLLPITETNKVDFDLLERARAKLYEAGLHGRSYALFDLSRTYIEEMLFLQKTGNLSDDRRVELLVEARNWGELGEEQFVGFGEGFFQAKLPNIPGLQEDANQRLMAMIEDFEVEQVATVGQRLLSEVPAELAEEVKFCSN